MRDTGKPVYLDNGATSFPKPPAVEAAMSHFLLEVGGSPGRSGHRLSQEAARVVFECREALARLIGAPDSKRVVFTLNATQALNTAIYGTLRQGDRVVTTSMEHNSVMRPLRDLEHRGVIELRVVPCDQTGSLDPRLLEEAVRAHRPRLVAAVHASNVTGSVIPLREIGVICRAAGALLLVDAAQSAGALPIDVEADHVDLLAFTGHKSLLGPQGTGGLWAREGIDPEPLVRGGRGATPSSKSNRSSGPTASRAARRTPWVSPGFSPACSSSNTRASRPSTPARRRSCAGCWPGSRGFRGCACTGRTMPRSAPPLSR